jgi:hypothetical protein
LCLRGRAMLKHLYSIPNVTLFILSSFLCNFLVSHVPMTSQSKATFLSLALSFLLVYFWLIFIHHVCFPPQADPGHDLHGHRLPRTWPTPKPMYHRDRLQHRAPFASQPRPGSIADKPSALSLGFFKPLPWPAWVRLLCLDSRLLGLAPNELDRDGTRPYWYPFPIPSSWC